MNKINHRRTLIFQVLIEERNEFSPNLFQFFLKSKYLTLHTFLIYSFLIKMNSFTYSAFRVTNFSFCQVLNADILHNNLFVHNYLMELINYIIFLFTETNLALVAMGYFIDLYGLYSMLPTSTTVLHGQTPFIHHPRCIANFSTIST